MTFKYVTRTCLRCKGAFTIPYRDAPPETACAEYCIPCLEEMQKEGPQV